MSLFLYNIFIALYRFGIGLTALYNDKARKWAEGRKHWKAQLRKQLESKKKGKTIWVHCASLGEFEQGRPVIEALREQYPNCTIALSFFSPSGYEIRKDYEQADIVFYLPMDSKANAQELISLLQPSLVLFVKYEFWYHYLHTLKQRNIPTLLISGAFRESQLFFKGYGKFYRALLGNFSYLLVQDERSKKLLGTIGYTDNVQVMGDTRYDRVAAIAAQSKEFPVIEAFRYGHHLLIAGSTWPRDEQALKTAIDALPADWKVVLAPHEVNKGHIEQVQRLFGEEAIRYTDATNGGDMLNKKLLIIDNIGMLSSLYRYGTIAFVGGGFEAGGIHNILEPAIYGLPVIFGPIYQKFVEANELVALHYAFPVHDREQLYAILQDLSTDTGRRTQVHDGLLQHMRTQKGATEKITALVQEHHWLDN